MRPLRRGRCHDDASGVRFSTIAPRSGAQQRGISTRPITPSLGGNAARVPRWCSVRRSPCCMTPRTGPCQRRHGHPRFFLASKIAGTCSGRTTPCDRRCRVDRVLMADICRRGQREAPRTPPRGSRCRPQQPPPLTTQGRGFSGHAVRWCRCVWASTILKRSRQRTRRAGVPTGEVHAEAPKASNTWITTPRNVVRVGSVMSGLALGAAETVARRDGEHRSHFGHRTLPSPAPNPKTMPMHGAVILERFGHPQGACAISVVRTSIDQYASG